MARPNLVTTMPTLLETHDNLKELISTSTAGGVHAFISPRFAKELIMGQPPQYQRRLDRNTIALYRRQMAAHPSKWRHHQADNLLLFDTDLQMMEGQHRCIACVEANEPFGAWIVGNQKKEDIKYLGQTRARTLAQTMQMFGEHNAAKLAGVAKMFLFWTINESPLAPGRISPDEADDILATYPEIHEWFLQAMRIRKGNIATPSIAWLTYILGQMCIADENRGRVFAAAIEKPTGEMMPGLLIRTWGGRKVGSSIADKVWYHNTAARAWNAHVTGEDPARLIVPRDKLLEWIVPKEHS